MYTNEMMKSLHQLQQYIQHQEQKLNQLSKTIDALQSEVEEIKSKPSTNIEKIEYKFDQLKVERLEGTLNIGLNPTDPNQIDQFEVQHQNMNIHNDVTSQQQHRQLNEQLFQQCHEEIQHFLNKDCIAYLEAAEQQLQLRLDEPHRRHIIEDIRKQVDGRIQYYMNSQPINDVHQFSEHKDRIVNKVKKDVEDSITHFMQHLPKEGGTP
ncbi:spore germination protein GerPC [Metabacillus malikii]|uniref:Spore germination protein PC n=1 Tax=Metabacillus malikii TaxID=1504265 RepID=A0ABT9ZL49_9BACI|nr:spore germination protein GerPC [Metabacillus malikii]MDQ0232248.1 spore germination protein PC [Metabacillus malikii]